MEEKKEIKVKLNTVILLFIIFILIIALGITYYLGFIKKNNTETDVISNNSTVKETTRTSENKEQNNKQNGTETNQNTQKDNSKNIIMYSGVNIANAKPGIYTSVYEEEKYPDYYNTTYDMYKNGKNIGKTNVILTEEYSAFFDDICYYININDGSEKGRPADAILVSCNYDVAPREYKMVNEIPSKIRNDFLNSDSLKMQTIDLNGDGKKEYIVAYAEMKREISGVYLYDSDYKKVSILVTQNHMTDLADLDNITYMDIDNDNNMEIIIKIPTASEYSRWGIYKYENGSIKGDIDTF